MKRIHLIEFEDLFLFPDWLRNCMTRLIMVMHRLVGTKDKVAELLNGLIEKSGKSTIVDYCSGSGGPMPDVLKSLQTIYGKDDIHLVLSDLYPDSKAMIKFNGDEDSPIEYISKPVDVTSLKHKRDGIQTMIGSFHHFKPNDALKILKEAQSQRQPFCLFELSDNSTPLFLWWIAIPINFLMALFITPMVRPMTIQQVFFTYLIPVIPLFFAWDGAASNARTYTLEDLDELLDELPAADYKWEKGIFEGISNQIYVIGYSVEPGA
ncbi:MAG: hypothetical protein RI564_06230 [Gracilimonas sp.]|nr:hypothetical protein [Gracilimonas sp.]